MRTRTRPQFDRPQEWASVNIHIYIFVSGYKLIVEMYNLAVRSWRSPRSQWSHKLNKIKIMINYDHLIRSRRKMRQRNKIFRLFWWVRQSISQEWREYFKIRVHVSLSFHPSFAGVFELRIKIQLELIRTFFSINIRWIRIFPWDLHHFLMVRLFWMKNASSYSVGYSQQLVGWLVGNCG